MIAKLHEPNSNLYGVLEYNFKKVLEGEATVHYTRGLGFSEQNEEWATLNEVYGKMMDFMPDRFRTKKITFHCSINPHPDDPISEEAMQYFIDDYMEELGYGDQPYIVFKHNDIDREHYHVVSINVDQHGKKINDSYSYRRSWNVLQELSKKYNLKLPSEHKKKGTALVLPEPIIYEEGDLANKIRAAVRATMEDYQPKSIGELSAILYRYNIELEVLKNEGGEERGLLYYVVDEEGKQQGRALRASDLGHHYLMKQLRKQFEANQKRWKKWKEKKTNRIKFAVAWAMRNTKDPVRFIEQMQELGVDVHLRFTKEGKIYGATYIDNEWGVVCNGSEIGKNYSAKALDDYFNEVTQNSWSLHEERDGYIKNAIAWNLRNDLTLEEFIEAMGESGVEVTVSYDEDGVINNLTFADTKHYVILNSNDMEAPHSTILFQSYFQEGGENFWGAKYSKDNYDDWVLWQERAREEAKYYEKDLVDEMLDELTYSAGGGSNNEVAIGRMYQRQAERSWNRTMRRARRR